MAARPPMTPVSPSPVCVKVLAGEIGSVFRESRTSTLALRTLTLPDGEPIHRWHVPPKDRDELLKFVEMEEGMPGDAHGAMTAGLSGLRILSRKMDAKHGTSYSPRIDAYAEFANDVRSGAYPAKEHQVPVDSQVAAAFAARLGPRRA